MRRSDALSSACVVFAIVCGDIIGSMSTSISSHVTHQMLTTAHDASLMVKYHTIRDTALMIVSMAAKILLSSQNCCVGCLVTPSKHSLYMRYK